MLQSKSIAVSVNIAPTAARDNVAVLADLSAKSPGKLNIYIMRKNNVGVRFPKICRLILKTKSMASGWLSVWGTTHLEVAPAPFVFLESVVFTLLYHPKLLHQQIQGRPFGFFRPTLAKL